MDGLSVFFIFIFTTLCSFICIRQKKKRNHVQRPPLFSWGDAFCLLSCRVSLWLQVIGAWGYRCRITAHDCSLLLLITPAAAHTSTVRTRLPSNPSRYISQSLISPPFHKRLSPTVPSRLQKLIFAVLTSPCGVLPGAVALSMIRVCRQSRCLAYNDVTS